MSGWAGWTSNLNSLSRTYRPAANMRGMVTAAELCLAETYARYSYTGVGKIVELGCWLGAITVALARGLSDNSQTRTQRPIEAFDHFRWEAWMTPIAEQLGCPRVPEGQSFLEHTKANVRPYEHLVELHEQDLLEPHRFQDPIEFLFIDAMKSWELASAITQTYFPLLIGGRSLLVQQDFGHHNGAVASNHILMWLIREHAIPIYHVPYSCSVVFFVQRPFTLRELPPLRRDAVTIEMADQAWAYSIDIVGGECRRDVWLSKIQFFTEQMWLDAAWEEAQRFVNTTGFASGQAAQDVRCLVARKQESSVVGEDRSKLADLGKLLCGW